MSDETFEVGDRVVVIGYDGSEAAYTAFGTPNYPVGLAGEVVQEQGAPYYMVSLDEDPLGVGIEYMGRSRVYALLGEELRYE